jgi:hypothetical protein
MMQKDDGRMLVMFATVSTDEKEYLGKRYWVWVLSGINIILVAIWVYVLPGVKDFMDYMTESSLKIFITAMRTKQDQEEISVRLITFEEYKKIIAKGKKKKN